MRRLAVIVATTCVVAGCGGGAAPPAARVAAPPFADPPRPLGFVDGGAVQERGPLSVHNVTFAGPSGRVAGFLVQPPGRHRKLPAVLLLHGSGGDRAQLLPTAKWIAARGAVALTVTAPSSLVTAGGTSPSDDLRRQREIATDDVLAARRAVDVLRAQPGVDPARIGLLGWSAGARTGAILAGVEPRLRTLVLMSGGAVPVAEYAAAAPAALRPAVRRELTKVDPLRWIARGRPGTILLQDGRSDGVVPQPALRALAAAAPKGTQLRWYDAGHPLNVAAERDQLAWLVRKLAIRGPRVAGAPIGP